MYNSMLFSPACRTHSPAPGDVFSLELPRHSPPRELLVTPTQGDHQIVSFSVDEGPKVVFRGLGACRCSWHRVVLDAAQGTITVLATTYNYSRTQVVPALAAAGRTHSHDVTVGNVDFVAICTKG